MIDVDPNSIPASTVLDGLEPYDPKSLPADVLLSANESPVDVPMAIKHKMLDRIANTPFNRYPDPCANELRSAIAANIRSLVLPSCPANSKILSEIPAIDFANVVVGNGGDELLFNTFLAFCGPGSKYLNVPPTFGVYTINAQLTSTEVVEVPRGADFAIDEDAIVDRASKGDISLVIVTSPNNPTGDTASRDFIKRLCKSTNALVMVDEAYGEFAERTCLPLLSDYGNLCILRTFSKAYALAGVRLGYVIAAKSVIDRYLMVRQPYSVDRISQIIGEEVCSNISAYTQSVRATIDRRRILESKLSNIRGVEVFPSQANYIMIRVPGAHAIWELMAQNDKILVRDFSSTPMLEDCLRITVGSDSENDAMLASLAENVMKGFAHAKR